MTRFVEPQVQENDASGDVYPGGKLYFYVSETVTPKTVWTDIDLSIPHTNPVVADAAGRFDSIFMDGSAHRVVFTDQKDVQVWAIDDVYGLPGAADLQPNIRSQIESFTATAAQVLFTLTTYTYTPGQNQLLVFVNGALQIPVTNFTETSTSSFTLTSGAEDGDTVVAVIGTPVSTNFSSFDLLAVNLTSTLTIASGVITVTGSHHKVDTEAAAASDDLDTISGGVTDRVLILRSTDSARTVVAKDGTGNLNLAGDFSMDNVDDRLLLQYDGTNWIEISRSDNG